MNDQMQKEKKQKLIVASDPILLFLFLAVIIAIAFVAMYIFLLVPSLTNIDNAAFENSLSAGGRAKDAVEHFINNKIILLQVKSEELKRYERAKSSLPSTFFDQFFRYDQAVQSVYRISEEGYLTDFFSLRESQTRSIQEYRATQLFENIGAGKIYISPIFFNEHTEPVMTIVVPHKIDSTRERYGALGADINLLPLFNDIKNLKAGDKGRIYVVDARGNMVGEPSMYAILKGVNVMYRDVVREVLGQQHVVRDRNYINEYHSAVRAVALPIESFGWAVVAEQPQKEIDDKKKQIIYIVSGICAMVAILIYFLVRSTLRLAGSISLVQEQQQEITTMVENLIDGVIEHDDHNVVFLINSVAQEILGVTQQNILYHQVDDALPAAFDPYENMRNMFSLRLENSAPSYQMLSYVPLGKGGDVRIGEITIEKPVPRNLVIIESSFFIMGRKGIERRMVKIIRDITREHLITQLKSDFITIAAHQLRTPLSAVKWTFRMILDGDLGPLEPKQKEFLERGYDTNERMILLVGDLLRVSRIEEGKFGYKFQEGDFVAFVENAVKEYGPVFARKKLIVDFWKPTGPQILFFDPDRMKVVFINIFDNAVNYTPEGGSIAIAVEEQEEFVAVSVKDSGVGIPERQIHRVFSKFFRGENVVRLKTEGSGLGLYIVRNVIHAHGGNVWVDSKEGEGTKLSFRLPRKKELIPKEEKPAEPFFEFMREL